MDAVFKALADESRRAILDRLYQGGGQTLGELCEPFAPSMSRQAVMKHLRILESANLVTVVWSGREKRHYLNPVPIHAVQARWIKKFENARLDAIHALKAALEEPQTKEKKHAKK
ncbi:MAG TPA: helix-turn-helix domain-containing protein [Bdellovibrionota bacterium]|jgi:DNA-binding transcriptional ArsR family regulator|nr:helix-turn-helix domain-containing protein [Bdellovibrionota bacterium]